jgi:hypothetical protein
MPKARLSFSRRTTLPSDFQFDESRKLVADVLTIRTLTLEQSLDDPSDAYLEIGGISLYAEGCTDRGTAGFTVHDARALECLGNALLELSRRATKAGYLAHVGPRRSPALVATPYPRN